MSTFFWFFSAFCFDIDIGYNTDYNIDIDIDIDIGYNIDYNIDIDIGYNIDYNIDIDIVSSLPPSGYVEKPKGVIVPRREFPATVSDPALGQPLRLIIYKMQKSSVSLRSPK